MVGSRAPLRRRRRDVGSYCFDVVLSVGWTLAAKVGGATTSLSFADRPPVVVRMRRACDFRWDCVGSLLKWQWTHHYFSNRMGEALKLSVMKKGGGRMSNGQPTTAPFLRNTVAFILPSTHQHNL